MDNIVALFIGGPHRNEVMAVPRGIHSIVVARSRLHDVHREYTKREGPTLMRYERGNYYRTSHMTIAGKVIFEWMGWEGDSI